MDYGPWPSQFIEVWEPEAAPSWGTAVLLHGGFWRDRWDLRLMDALAADLAARGWRVANVEYRRVGADGGGWPTTFDDVLAALGRSAKLGRSVALSDGVRPNAASAEPVPSELGRSAALSDGVRPNAASADDVVSAGKRAGGWGKVAVIGHSAGGHLALWATAERPDLVDAVVALAPVSDLAEASRLGLSDYAVHGLLGGSPVDHSDRYRSTDPMVRLPLGRRTLVVHGTVDTAVPLALSDAYVEAARAAGDDVTYHRLAGVDHFAVIDPGSAAWQGVVSWLSTVTKP